MTMSKNELHIVYGGIIVVLAYWAYTNIKGAATTAAQQGGNQGAAQAVNTFIQASPTMQSVQSLDAFANDAGQMIGSTGNNLAPTLQNNPGIY